MKNFRICPKCESDNIMVVDGEARSYRAGNNIMIGMTILSAIKVNRYICCDCGYTEEWINEEDIERLMKSSKAHR